jgi:hypothetical protein
MGRQCVCSHTVLNHCLAQPPSQQQLNCVCGVQPWKRYFADVDSQPGWQELVHIALAVAAVGTPAEPSLPCDISARLGSILVDRSSADAVAVTELRLEGAVQMHQSDAGGDEAAFLLQWTCTGTLSSLARQSGASRRVHFIW